eukprot:1143628-Pelagomonas_calceolata.AAC.1
MASNALAPSGATIRAPPSGCPLGAWVPIQDCPHLALVGQPVMEPPVPTAVTAAPSRGGTSAYCSHSNADTIITNATISNFGR